MVEPHVYGIKVERKMLLVYQIGGGTSSGSIPDWRLVPIDEITDLKKTNEIFANRRELPTGDYSNWDTIISQVQ